MGKDDNQIAELNSASSVTRQNSSFNNGTGNEIDKWKDFIFNQVDKFLELEAKELASLLFLKKLNKKHSVVKSKEFCNIVVTK